MTRKLLSLLWVVLTVNFIFCDVFTLMYFEDLKNILSGKVGSINITQEFLLFFAIIMEIPMLMIVLSRFLNRKINRLLNLVFSFLLIVVQLSSLMAEKNTLHYTLFSIIEIGILGYIIWVAWRWKENDTEYKREL